MIITFFCKEEKSKEIVQDVLDNISKTIDYEISVYENYVKFDFIIGTPTYIEKYYFDVPHFIEFEKDWDNKTFRFFDGNSYATIYMETDACYKFDPNVLLSMYDLFNEYKNNIQSLFNYSCPIMFYKRNDVEKYYDELMKESLVNDDEPF